MANTKQKFAQFLKTPVGILLLFAVIFYAITFAVYYFYSPGPEERAQMQAAATSSK
jgi:hypothetical protein